MLDHGLDYGNRLRGWRAESDLGEEMEFICFGGYGTAEHGCDVLRMAALRSWM